MTVKAMFGMHVNMTKNSKTRLVIPHRLLVLCIITQGLWFLLRLRFSKDLYNTVNCYVSLRFILSEQNLLIFTQ